MNIPIRSILQPSQLSMIAVAASFVAWTFPAFDVLQKGFRNSSQLDLTAAVVLSCWYLLIFTSFFIGQKVGEVAIYPRPAFVDTLVGLDSNVMYYAYTLIAAVGVGTTVFRIFHSLSLREAIILVSLSQTNMLREAFLEDYSIGLLSLRHAVMFPASIALYRIVRYKKLSPVNILNVFLLVILAFLSYRLILIATAVSTALLFSADRRVLRISATKIGLTACLLFLVLSGLNFSRNGSYYEKNGLSFWLAGLNEIDAYLGTPFQVAVATAGVTDQLVAGGEGGANGQEPYRSYADILILYNTNSAFVHLHQQFGYFAWLYIPVLCGAGGFLFSMLYSLGRTAFLLPCGAILYGAAELWRLPLFHQGTFVVWMVVGLGVPLALLFASACWKTLQRFGGADTKPLSDF